MYLHAELLAKRLQRMPMELGIEVLVCITRRWLRADKKFDLHTWWPSDRKPPIIIYSVAGFDHISPEGPATDRALANAAVSGLAGLGRLITTNARQRIVRCLSTTSAMKEGSPSD